MTTRAKQMCLVLVAQAVCIGVGLWMQQRFATMAVRDAATEDAWTQLERGARDFVAALDESAFASSPPNASDLDAIHRFLSSHHPACGDALFVDAQWRVMVDWARGKEQVAHRIPPGQGLKWTDASASSNTQGTLEVPVGVGASARGFIEMPGGAHVAVGYPLGDGRGRVLIHNPLGEVGQATVGLLDSLPTIGLITLFWTWALTSVAVYMIMAWFHDGVDRERVRATTDTLRRKQNLIRTRDAVIFGLAKLADSRDPETGQHLERISIYSTKLTAALRPHPRFSDEVTPGFVRLIGISSALHDIGKVGIEDAILLKPAALTKDERARMQLHTVIGGICLQEIEQRLGSSNFLQMAREIAFAHHERWDGTGYPNGLSGEEIPLSARIVAIVDVYDALSSKRVYKEPIPHEECVDIIRQEAGGQFDPDLVETWLTLEAKFRAIAAQHTEPVPERSRSGPASRELHRLETSATVP